MSCLFEWLIFPIHPTWCFLSFLDLWFGTCTNFGKFSASQRTFKNSVGLIFSFPSGIPITGMWHFLIQRVAQIGWGFPDFRVSQLLAWKYSQYQFNLMFFSCHLKLLSFKYVNSEVHTIFDTCKSHQGSLVYTQISEKGILIQWIRDEVGMMYIYQAPWMRLRQLTWGYI